MFVRNVGWLKSAVGGLWIHSTAPRMNTGKRNSGKRIPKKSSKNRTLFPGGNWSSDWRYREAGRFPSGICCKVLWMSVILDWSFMNIFWTSTPMKILTFIPAALPYRVHTYVVGNLRNTVRIYLGFYLLFALLSAYICDPYVSVVYV